MTRLAVVIPCHDDGELARQAVASLEEAEPVEIVVVDDGSTAETTLRALAELEAGGIRVVRQDQAGLGPARMTGVAAASARYVFPLDADDLLVAGSLARLADRLDAAPGAAFAWGDYEVFGDYRGRYRAPARFLPWTLLYLNVYPVGSLMRRDVLERSGGWHALPAYEDWDLWLRYVGLGHEGVRADCVAYRRRLHGGGRMLATARRRHRHLYRALRERNGAVFDARRELLRRERPAVWKRVAYPAVFGRRAIVPDRVLARVQRATLERAWRVAG